MTTLTPEEQIEAWNREFCPGTTVVYRPIFEKDDDKVTTTTTSPAYVLGGHTAVVMINGVSGCVALRNVEAC